MFSPSTGWSGFLPKRGSCLDRRVQTGFKQKGEETDKNDGKASKGTYHNEI